MAGICVVDQRSRAMLSHQNIGHFEDEDGPEQDVAIEGGSDESSCSEQSENALLADLQNVTSQQLSSPNGHGSGVANSSPRLYRKETTTQYKTNTGPQGSLNRTTTTTVTKSTDNYDPFLNHENVDSPLYQNRQIIKETITTTSSSHRPVTPPVNNYNKDPNQNAAALNNNLSELDTLLDDLNAARYQGYLDRRGEWYKGSPNPQLNGPVSPSLNVSQPSPTSSMSSAEPRPGTVDSISEEFNRTSSPSSPRGHNVTWATDRRTMTTTSGPTASSATKELDDLMASLSDFKLNANQLQNTARSPSGGPENEYARVNKSPRTPPAKHNNIDAMLGSLQANMSKLDLDPGQKGCCVACSKPIVGQVVTALGKTWHPEHFTCAHCKCELGNKNFFERDGKPYCEKDYHELFSPRCAYCNGPIRDKCVTALDKTWHPEHFFCAQCGSQFGEDGFHEKDGKPYCRDDYFDMFAPKCGGCSRPIMENYISALNTQWHADCFVCRDCRMPFNGGSFFDHEGLPYCETHYHAKRGSLCAGCHKPIQGRCITAMFRKFHPEHFVCSFCLKQLNKGTFKEQNDKPYCHACFEKLFGKVVEISK